MSLYQQHTKGLGGLLLPQPVFSWNAWEGSVPKGFTFTRATAGTYFDKDKVLQTASSGVPRIDFDPLTGNLLGYLSEAQATNLLLWNRDLTNAVWVAVNVTAAKDETGIDGAANTASSLTSTAANGTLLQALVLSAASRTFSFYIKRITGTGNIDISQDGVTWTTVTITSSWTRVSLTASQLNPTVGFRIVTSGDKVAVDYGQYETGTFTTSAIETTSSSVVRNTDILTNSKISYYNHLEGTFLVEARKDNNVSAAINTVVSMNNANTPILSDNRAALLFTGAGVGTTVSASRNMSIGAIERCAYSYKSGNHRVAISGELSGTSTNTTVPARSTTGISIGNRDTGTEPFNGWVRQVKYFNQAIRSDAAIRRLTKLG